MIQKNAHTSSQIVDHWDGESYASTAQLQGTWADKFFFQNYQFNGSEHVLDIGSGDGKLTARIAKAAPEGLTIGIDNSESMIAKANMPFNALQNLKF